MIQPLEMKPGERYTYYGSEYEVISCDKDRAQLRSLQRSKDIKFQSTQVLIKAWQKGDLRKTQEAPFSTQPQKIIATLSEKNRKIFERRIAYVNEALARFNGRLPTKNTEKLIKEISASINDNNPPCYQTLYNWIKAYLATNGNPTSLLPSFREITQQRITLQPHETQEIIKYQINIKYLRKEPETINSVIDSITQMIQVTNTARPSYDQIPVPSYTTLYRIIKELDRYEKDLKQKGKAAAQKDQKHSRMATPPRYLLEVAQSDSHPLDIFVVDEYGEVLGRPVLTIIMEIKTRHIIGWDISLNSPSLQKTLRALKMSMSASNPYGGLAMLYILDNGPENIAAQLRIILKSFGSKITFCEVGNPDQNPNVERFFSTFETQIIHSLAGTTFSNIIKRGDYDSESEAIHTLEEIRETFKNWLENDYHKATHSEIKTSPRTAWLQQTSAFSPRRFSEDDINRLFLRSVYVKPTDAGRVRYNNLFWSGPGVPFLATLDEKKSDLILLYDPSELGHAWITHPNHRDRVYRVEAVNPRYQIGLTLDMHLSIRDQLKKNNKSFSEIEATKFRVKLLEELSVKNKSKKQKSKNKHQPTEVSATSSAMTSAPVFIDHQNSPEPFSIVELPNEAP